MITDSLIPLLDKSLNQARFTDRFRYQLSAEAMRQLYQAGRRVILISTDDIHVERHSLCDLASTLGASLGNYRSPSGTVGNGLYLLKGTSGSPRLPSIEDYAKVLVLAASRLGSARVTDLFSGWLEGERVQQRECALIKGILIEDIMEPVTGMRLEKVPLNTDDLGIRIQVDDYGMRHDQFDEQTLFFIKYETICPLYDPESFQESFTEPIPMDPVNPALEFITSNSFCRAMSLETNQFVDWSRQWGDYGEVEAFFLQGNTGGMHKDLRAPRNPRIVSESDVRDALSIHEQLRECQDLNLPIARWLRSKRSPANHEKLIELRIALESIFLHGDNEGEKSYRLAVRGACLLGETVEERKSHFELLRDIYNYASIYIHGGVPKVKDEDELKNKISLAQNLCHDAILRFSRDGKILDSSGWKDLMFDQGKVKP